jgi:hypothetical protein
MHRLRKTAARTLADAGCDVVSIMAITGHKSLSVLMELHQGRAAARARESGHSAARRAPKENRDCQTWPATKCQTGGKGLL